MQGGEALIPGWGQARQAYYDYRRGDIVLGVARSINALGDLVTVGSIARGGARMVVGAATRGGEFLGARTAAEEGTIVGGRALSRRELLSTGGWRSGHVINPFAGSTSAEETARTVVNTGVFDTAAGARGLEGGATVSSQGAAIDIRATAAESAGTLPEGSFSIRDWSGYHQGAPQPQGPFRLLEGDEYNAARSAANSANRALRQADPAAYAGQHIHEIQPVKFGGSPTDLANKVPLTPQVHSQFTNWWNAMMRSINGG